MEYAVIMAGGRGTRLWPFSRNDRPKQLLPLIAGNSLLQLSYQRLRAILPPERILICTAAVHRDAVLANLPELPPDNVLGEPKGMDTANAVGFPAQVLLKKDPHAVMAIVTADHVIEPQEIFVRSMRTAFALVAEQPRALVTFGIAPTHGHPGLGYVQRGDALHLKANLEGAYKVIRFVEKPAKPEADRFVESGRYYWNSGMFVWRCDTVLEELAIHLPKSAEGLAEIGKAWGTEIAQRVLEDTYPTLTKKSIDHGVLEPASQGKGKAHVVVVEMPVNWLDVGSWPALSETLPNDSNQNAVDSVNAVLLDSFNNIVVSYDPAHVVALLGVSDMIVIHTPDATLVCPKTEDQRVKDLVDKVKEKTGDKHQ